MTRPRLLDLYCGAGGAAMGYHRAGFEVVGVDNRPQPHYPFRFWQLDVLELEPWVLCAFEAVHASPPCQAFSILGRAWPDRTWPDLIEPTRQLLRASGRPYVIENVVGAPLENPVTICGSGRLPLVACHGGKVRQVQRHRLFETNWPLLVSPCFHTHPALGVYGRGRWSNDGSKHRGGYQGNAAENAAGMGIDWMTRDELNQSIPPAFTELIGAQLVDAI